MIEMYNCVGPYLGYSCYYTGRHGNIDDTCRQQLVVCQMLRDTGQVTRTSGKYLIFSCCCFFLVSPIQFKHQNCKEYDVVYLVCMGQKYKYHINTSTFKSGHDKVRTFSYPFSLT